MWQILNLLLQPTFESLPCVWPISLTCSSNLCETQNNATDLFFSDANTAEQVMWMEEGSSVHSLNFPVWSAARYFFWSALLPINLQIVCIVCCVILQTKDTPLTHPMWFIFSSQSSLQCVVPMEKPIFSLEIHYNMKEKVCAVSFGITVLFSFPSKPIESNVL